MGNKQCMVEARTHQNSGLYTLEIVAIKRHRLGPKKE
jgi:hypothetical protein